MSPGTSPDPFRSLSRRTFLGASAASVLLALAGCAPAASGRLPELRLVGVGLEDMTEGSAHLAALAEQLARVNANAVSLVAGRVDWSAFPWEGHEERWASAVGDDVDVVAEARDALGAGADDERELILVIDVLAPALIAERPDLAGHDSHGDVVEEWPSLVALTKGEVADLIVEFVDAVADRYHPLAISLTELFLDDTTFNDADLDDFREHSGADDWPRRDDGSIDGEDAAIASWRSDAVAGLVERARDAASRHDVELWMEVRAPKTDASDDRRESGHDYEQLREVADRLVLWDYFGIADPGSPSTAELSTAFRDLLGDRAVVSPGLWGDGDSVVSPSALADSVRAAGGAGIATVWPTPVSLFTDAHWEALAEVWSE